MLEALITVALAIATLPSEDVLLDKIAEVGRSMNLTEITQDRSQKVFVWRQTVKDIGPQECAMFFAWSIRRLDDQSMALYDPVLSGTGCLEDLSPKDRSKAVKKFGSQAQDTQREFIKRFVKLVGPVKFAPAPDDLTQLAIDQLRKAKNDQK